MKYEGRMNFLNVLLSVMLFFTVLPFISVIVYVIEGNGGEIIDNFLKFIVRLVLFYGYFIILFTLKKVLKSIKSKNPFIPENILHFRKIGLYILMIGVVEAIINYPKPSNAGLEIMAFGSGSLKPIFFLYLVLSIMSYVLSDVFRMAMEIKDENDLTV